MALPRMHRFGFAVLVLGLVFIVYIALNMTFNVWWQGNEQIKAFLLTQTPIGATEESVLTWVHNGHDGGTTCSPQEVTAPAPPIGEPTESLDLRTREWTELPPSTAHIASEHGLGYVPEPIGWVMTCIVEHHTQSVFDTNVFVKYRFDSERRLTSLEVTRITEGP